jgi:hypothetical protein
MSKRDRERHVKRKYTNVQVESEKYKYCRGLPTVSVQLVIVQYYGASLSIKKSASGMFINPGTRLYIYAPKVE